VNRHHAAASSTPNLSAVIADELRRAGEVHARYRTRGDRDRLRQAGRRAGRLLGRPVQTHATPGADSDEHGTVIITITDWGTANPLESRLTTSRANNAIDRALDT
jgi:hypothetical protein